VIGDRGLSVWRSTREPRLIDQIRGSKPLRARIIDLCKSESATFQLPGINAGFPVAVGIVEQVKTIFGNRIGAETTPAVDGIVNSEDTFVQAEFP
jgi:hypothetical protein